MMNNSRPLYCFVLFIIFMFFERVSGYQSNPNASLYQTTKNAKIIIPVMLNTKDDDETIKGELTLKGTENDVGLDGRRINL